MVPSSPSSRTRQRPARHHRMRPCLEPPRQRPFTGHSRRIWRTRRIICLVKMQLRITSSRRGIFAILYSRASRNDHKLKPGDLLVHPTHAVCRTRSRAVRTELAVSAARFAVIMGVPRLGRSGTPGDRSMTCCYEPPSRVTFERRI